MKLMKIADDKLRPVANEMIKMLGNQLNIDEIRDALEGMLTGLTGKSYGIALQQVGHGTIERLRHDLSQGRVNLNIIPSEQLLELIASMQPARADKYRQFVAMDRLGSVNEFDRPTVKMESLSTVKTFTLLYVDNGDGTFSISGVVVLYGSSLTSWAQQAGLKRSQCSLSRWPSTHYLENPAFFVKVFQ